MEAQDDPENNKLTPLPKLDFDDEEDYYIDEDQEQKENPIIKEAVHHYQSLKKTIKVIWDAGGDQHYCAVSIDDKDDVIFKDLNICRAVSRRIGRLFCSIGF